MLRLVSLPALIVSITFATATSGQPIPVSPPPEVHVCPGAFPTDLTQTIDCRYTAGQRLLTFVSGSVTDQSMLSAVIYGAGAQIIQSPSQWGRTWEGYGRRVGSRYTQAVGKGAAEYLVGSIMQDDPRFLAYCDDPRVIRSHQDAVRTLSSRLVPDADHLPNSEPPGHRPAPAKSLDALTHDGWQRFGHAWLEVITVRRSSLSGDGARIPAISRFAGEIGGAYAGYPWYPGADNTPTQVGERAAGAFGTAVLSSFYTEYQPEITGLLGAIFRRGQSKSAPGGQP
jgi:hypothetical protein